MVARIRIVTGKGGVGKTVVTSALALAEAERGNKVLIAEVREGGRVTALLEDAVLGSEPREVRPGIFAVMLNPEDAMHEYALSVLRFEALYRAVFENRFIRGLVRLVPSLSELMLLTKILAHAEPQRAGAPSFDVIIVDAPATGHLRDLLSTPRAVRAMIPHGPLPKLAARLDALLGDHARCEVNVVLTAEEMPVSEALELDHFVREEMGMAMGRMIINKRLPVLPAAALEKLRESAPRPLFTGSLRALDLWQQRAEDGDRELMRLSSRAIMNAVSLPRLTAPRFGLVELARLAERLRPVVA